MNRRDFVISALACGAGPSAPSRLPGQAKAVEPDLAKLAEGKSLKVFNRSVSSLSDGARKGVRLNENPGEGVAYLEGIEFANGSIELDIRGKDVQQQSFVVSHFMVLTERLMTRSTSVRSTSGRKIRQDASAPYSTSPVHLYVAEATG